jgi:2,3-bisphosphoglycerate-dependent phosphoglycerate mutase
MSARLVLVRHGQSQWNQENRFTGWVDVPLSSQGVQEAEQAGSLLKAKGFHFDVAHTSLLKRAIKTCWILLEQMDQMWVPIAKEWRLNERHYGALTGLNKDEMIAKHGAEQVQKWRRSYALQPPAMTAQDKSNPSLDPRYARVAAGDKPLTESLKDTLARVLPYWEATLEPQLRQGKQVLVAAHGNSIRALIKHIDQMSEDAIVELNIPTGSPFVYEFDSGLKKIRSGYAKDLSFH